MNIHFKDENLFEQLMKSSLFQIEVGSSLYGLDTESSDKDILIIYAEGISNQKSFLWEHHQLQYKKDNIDYIFTTLPLFIRNWMSGDSTINFEVLFSEKLGSDENMNFLSRNKDRYYTYNIMKSYLGFAKRDLKTIRKNETENPNLYKKIAHFLRGVETVTRIRNNDYSNDFSHLKDIKLGKRLGVNTLIEEHESTMIQLRKKINEEFYYTDEQMETLINDLNDEEE